MSKAPAASRKIKTLAMPLEDYVDLEPVEVAAIRAWLLGEASHEQQMLSHKVVIEKLSMAYGLSYRPDNRGGDRATAFLEGRRAVGLWIVNLQHMSPKAFEKEPK